MTASTLCAEPKFGCRNPSLLEVRVLTLHFLVRLAAARTVKPRLLPFTPQFSPFPAYYLTYPYWHAMLSRVY
jgi:hypothetical protein